MKHHPFKWWPLLLGATLILLTSLVVTAWQFSNFETWLPAIAVAIVLLLGAILIYPLFTIRPNTKTDQQATGEEDPQINGNGPETEGPDSQ